MSVISHAFEAYFKNIKLIVFFSIPFLFALLIPILSPMPSFVALGGTFLRFGSLPADLTLADAAKIILFFFISLFLIAFTMVNINLIIKSQRTLTNIREEVIRGIERYTLDVFWLLLTAEVLCLAVDMLLYEHGLHKLGGALFTILVWLPLFYAPAAMVIDEMRPLSAMRMSLSMIRKRFKLFVMWIVVGIAVLSVLDLLFIMLKDFIFGAHFLVLVFNSLVVLPFLVVLQTQTYLTKYTILK